MPSSPSSMTVSSMTEPIFRIVDIVEGTSVDGPGLRTSIYFAGCSHKCPGCHNPQTWPHDAGYDISLNDLADIIARADFDVTLTGGDPVYQADKLGPLVETIVALGKAIWLYTGFTIEELKDNAAVEPWLPMVEAVVDGPFVESLRDLSLPFRGSSNQRIIYIKDIFN